MAGTSDQHFYRSRVKLTLILFILFVSISGIGLVTFFALKGVTYIAGIFITILLTLGFFITLKNLISKHPYLRLTEEALWINPASKYAIPIKWRAIEGYRKKKINHNTFLEVVLYDEEKYRTLIADQLRGFNKLHKWTKSEPFTIAWGQIKRSDREPLAYELERRISGEESDLPSITEKQSLKRKLQEKIMVFLYFISLLLLEGIVVSILQNIAPDSVFLLIVIIIVTAIIHFILCLFAAFYLDGFKDRHFAKEHNQITGAYRQSGNAEVFLNELSNMKNKPKTARASAAFSISMSTALHKNNRNQEALAYLDKVDTSGSDLQKAVEKQRQWLKEKTI